VHVIRLWFDICFSLRVVTVYAHALRTVTFSSVCTRCALLHIFKFLGSCWRKVQQVLVRFVRGLPNTAQYTHLTVHIHTTFTVSLHHVALCTYFGLFRFAATYLLRFGYVLLIVSAAALWLFYFIVYLGLERLHFSRLDTFRFHLVALYIYPHCTLSVDITFYLVHLYLRHSGSPFGCPQVLVTLRILRNVRSRCILYARTPAVLSWFLSPRFRFDFHAVAHGVHLLPHLHADLAAFVRLHLVATAGSTWFCGLVPYDCSPRFAHTTRSLLPRFSVAGTPTHTCPVTPTHTHAHAFFPSMPLHTHACARSVCGWIWFTCCTHTFAYRYIAFTICVVYTRSHTRGYLVWLHCCVARFFVCTVHGLWIG